MMRLFLTSLFSTLFATKALAHIGEGAHAHPETSMAAIAMISLAIVGIILWVRK